MSTCNNPSSNPHGFVPGLHHDIGGGDAANRFPKHSHQEGSKPIHRKVRIWWVVCDPFWVTALFLGTINARISVYLRLTRAAPQRYIRRVPQVQPSLVPDPPHVLRRSDMSDRLRVAAASRKKGNKLEISADNASCLCLQLALLLSDRASSAVR